MEEDDFFNMFACCIPVKGFKRSIICDLQRGEYKFIPNALVEILEQTKNKSIKEIRSEIDEENRTTFNEYIEYLITEDFGFFVSNKEKENFPKIDLTWERPQIISNAVIDHDFTSNFDYSKIVKELNFLGCQAVELRFFDFINLNKITTVLSNFQNSRIKSISIIFPYSTEYTIEELDSLFYQFPRLSFIVIHSAESHHVFDSVNSNGRIIYVENKIDSNAHCGIIDPAYFAINIEMFLEAQNYNSCLNKKISIDHSGFIKNCPSNQKNYGHYLNVSLIDVVNVIGYKDLWQINKDNILICKDCEFRYMCTDCRVFIENPENIYSKPAKCKYDPYSASWSV